MSHTFCLGKEGKVGRRRGALLGGCFPVCGVSAGTWTNLSGGMWVADDGRSVGRQEGQVSGSERVPRGATLVADPSQVQVCVTSTVPVS